MVKETGVVEIRLSWWTRWKKDPRPADLPVADFLDLVRGYPAGLLVAPTEEG